MKYLLKPAVSALVTGALVVTSFGVVSAAPSDSDPLVESQIQAIAQQIRENLPSEVLASLDDISSSPVSFNGADTLSLDGTSLELNLFDSASLGTVDDTGTAIQDGAESMLVNKTDTGAQIIYTIPDATSDHSRDFEFAGDITLVPAQEYGIPTDEVFLVK